MRIAYAILAPLISLLLITVQLLCYVAVFAQLLRLASHVHLIADVHENGWHWSMFGYGALFHFLLGALVFLVLVRVKLGKRPAVDWWRAPLVFLTVVNDTGLAGICVVSLCLAMALSTLFVCPLSPGPACVLLWVCYVLGWMPFVRKAWVSAGSLKRGTSEAGEWSAVHEAAPPQTSTG